MDVTIDTPQSPLPVDRAYTLSMVIRSFKGRRDVAVHLFRAHWAKDEEFRYDWDKVIGPPLDSSHTDAEASRVLVMESFTKTERDQIVNYLKEQYSTRLTSIQSSPLTFPVPAGLAGLSSVRPGKTLGFIEFEKIPSYPLELPLKGFYDLSQSPPMAQDSCN